MLAAGSCAMGAGATGGTGAGRSPVIVTRPAREAEHWVRQLRQCGLAAEALPLIEIAPASGRADVQALATAWKALDGYAACLFVSGNAVAYFFKGKTAPAPDLHAQPAINTIANAEGVPALEGLPPDLRFMAPGPGTVAALVAAGVPAAQIDAPAPDALQFDSEALWAVVGGRDWQGRRVLIVRGETLGRAVRADSAAVSNLSGLTNSPGHQGVAGISSRPTGSPGRDWISRQWLAAGAQVDFVCVYQRGAPMLTDAQVARARAASADGSVWLFSSSEAVANLVGLPSLSGVDWRQARAVATHPRIVQAVRAAGWGVVVESRPALKDINDSVASIESSQP